MATREYAGAAKRTTITGDITGGSTTISVADATGYPTGATGPFAIALRLGQAAEEKVLIASRSGNTLTVDTRGYDGTTASAHTSGATVDHVLTAIDIREANAHINATTGAHAATAISYAGSAGLAAVNVEAALDELDTEKLSTATAATLYSPIAARTARASQSGSQSISQSTWTAVALAAEGFDTSGFHDTVTDNSRFTVPAGMAGKYLVTAAAVWAATSVAGEFRIALSANGGRLRELPVYIPGVSVPVGQSISDVLTLAVGGYVELHVWQNASATRTLNDADVTFTYLGA